MKLLLKNARLLSMATDKPNILNKDILIDGNIIKQIDNNIDEIADKIIDCKNNILMPGFVNTHNHLAMSVFRGYKDDRKLMDWLTNAIWPIEDKFVKDDFYYNSYLSCIEMIKTGTTTCNDMYFGMIDCLRAIEDSGMRGIISWCITDNSINTKPEETIEYANKLNNKNSRIRVYASAHAPYTCNPETIKLVVGLAKKINSGIHIHLAETKDEENIIKSNYNKTPTEYLNDLGVFNVPVVLAHGIYFSDSDINILKNIKGGISHNPISNCKLASGICDVVKLKKNGITVGLGTDGIGSTTTLDMFEEMRVCAYLQKVKNLDSEAIKAYDILKMATIDGAKVMGLDDEIGSIEVGKKADMILIDINNNKFKPENDLCSLLVYAVTGNDVDTTIIDGKVIMENKKLINIDENNIEKYVLENLKKLY